MTASAEDIAWAKKALADGRSMSFIASVLEMSERKARNAVFGIDKIERQHFRARVESFAAIAEAEDAGPKKMGRPRLPRDETGEVLHRPGRLIGAAIAETPSRRKSSLRRQFARHWDMIWFLRGRGMAGRTLRQIYGADALIWSVGGGIDAEI